MTEIPLFDMDQPEPLKRVAPKTEKPRWIKCRIRIKCDDCAFALAKADGRGPLPRQARWKRTANGFDRYLCHEHARHWRDAESKDTQRMHTPTGWADRCTMLDDSAEHQIRITAERAPQGFKPMLLWMNCTCQLIPAPGYAIATAEEALEMWHELHPDLEHAS